MNKKVYGICSLVIIALFASTLIGISVDKSVSNAYASESTSQTEIEDENVYKYFRMLRDIYHLLREGFVDSDKISAKDLFYGAIKGMLAGTGDPHTTFFEPDQANYFVNEIQGKFGGLGIRIAPRDGYVTVIAPIPGTPAAKAGVQAGDQIVKIEDEDMKDVPIDQVMAKLRGEAGTKVKVSFAREGMLEPFDLNLKREIITVDSVKSSMISYNNKNYAYIKLIEFVSTSNVDFTKALAKLLAENPSGIIVDLRNNPGGLLNVAADIINLFQDKGLIVYTKGKRRDASSAFYADEKSTIVPKDLPLVLLVNQGSASASEIMSGAMKDTHRGILVGKKTFGKGSVQATQSLGDDGILKYTVARYYTPAGVMIDQIGIDPDVEIDAWFETLKDIEKFNILQLQQEDTISDYLEKNNNPSEADLINWKKSLLDEGYLVSIDSIKWLIYQHNYDFEEVYNLEFDNQLEKALEVVSNYKKYQKEKLTFYETPK